ncbi:hypothetical protein PHYSODRAFT_475460 [Phytophthora sojae]|uniref:Uncharacterized protein n=1 Tax=Phytophthora sojae (strain P6497) TaxID=1094619 RepID=G4YHW4_PHYSP|nr:hypothetical protein PHYSODRAFT_475460 [Phytophthora sojae]EGZ29691.1 hypothetical protein PHYSODRAFT_475460 [Phytophthora sojae]|eukprot:XP_009516966.1 hypothetical protein PHYSODRAFT_475460 [Phytophthora sojae]
MCRINEVLSLQWKNLTLGMTRPSTTDPSVSITFGVYKLDGRKTETDHSWTDGDYVFPALSKVAKSMSEQAFITLLNCVVRDLNRNGKSTRGYVRQEWRDIWFTSHTFRRAGAQYRFMFAVPERRWSLRMVKWCAGWTPNESSETLVRYLLDQAANDEEKQLADCLAPDREAHSGYWKDMYRMYWKADPSRHLFKPVSEWTAQDKKKSGALHSRLSNAASSDVNVLTMDTLARYIRLDRKRRLVKSRHAYLRD